MPDRQVEQKFYFKVPAPARRQISRLFTNFKVPRQCPFGNNKGLRSSKGLYFIKEFYGLRGLPSRFEAPETAI